jgi:hypothetical protein
LSLSGYLQGEKSLFPRPAFESQSFQAVAYHCNKDVVLKAWCGIGKEMGCEFIIIARFEVFILLLMMIYILCDSTHCTVK